MLLAVGSKNEVKVRALEEVIKGYPDFANAKIVSLSVPSEISDQPLSLEETIRGAKNRSKNAFNASISCAYSFGIESGIFEASGTRTGFLNVCVCSIYNGICYHIGLSCGFEVPSQIMDLVLDKKMDLSQACYHSGITANSQVGTAEGLIGILTKGRVNRKEYTKQSITTALIQLENAPWYTSKV